MATTYRPALTCAKCSAELTKVSFSHIVGKPFVQAHCPKCGFMTQQEIATDPNPADSDQKTTMANLPIKAGLLAEESPNR